MSSLESIGIRYKQPRKTRLVFQIWQHNSTLTWPKISKRSFKRFLRLHVIVVILQNGFKNLSNICLFTNDTGLSVSTQLTLVSRFTKLTLISVLLQRSYIRSTRVYHNCLLVNYVLITHFANMTQSSRRIHNLLNFYAFGHVLRTSRVNVWIVIRDVCAAISSKQLTMRDCHNVIWLSYDYRHKNI